MTPGTAVPIGKSVFGAPVCPVIVFGYYHRYITEHLELRKGRCPLIVPIKDNNAGKELSAATVSRWIRTTIVNSHATLRKSKGIPGISKVRAVATCTLLQLFNKVDPEAVMKADAPSHPSTSVRN